jgi:hypothetical protein
MPSELPPDAKLHRREFMAYVVERAESWHREHLGRLYRLWSGWNDDYFGGGCVAPYLMFSPPSIPRALGQYWPVTSFGGYGEVRIRENLATGKHPMLNPGAEYEEGRRLFVNDVCLHECLHAYQHEVEGRPERSYKGHGPAYAAACNRIGAALGLPPVRPAKCRGKDAHLPSCAQWPHNVRPPGYYLGAVLEPTAGRGKAKRGDRGAEEPPEDFRSRLERALEASHQLYNFLLGFAGAMSRLPCEPATGVPSLETFTAWLRQEVEALGGRLPTRFCHEAVVSPEGPQVLAVFRTPFGPNSNVVEHERSLREYPALCVALTVGVFPPSASDRAEPFPAISAIGDTAEGGGLLGGPDGTPGLPAGAAQAAQVGAGGTGATDGASGGERAAKAGVIEVTVMPGSGTIIRDGRRPGLEEYYFAPKDAPPEHGGGYTAYYWSIDEVAWVTWAEVERVKHLARRKRKPFAATLATVLTVAGLKPHGNMVLADWATDLARSRLGPGGGD